jgi:hypothetical protein
VEAEHVLRRLVLAAISFDVEIGGVGGEDRARLADAVELAEDLLLHVHILEHGLDDEVAIGEVFEGKRGREEAHGLADLLGAHLPLGRGRLVVLEDHAGAAVERVLLLLDDGDRDAGVRKFMEMPPPIVPAPITPTF